MPRNNANLAPDPHSGLTSSQIDGIKGVLILLIVIGHSDLLIGAFDKVYTAIYFFHVAAFFLLPFIYRPKKLSGSFVRDRAVRYLVPYTAFFLVSGAAYYLKDLAGQIPFSQWLGRMVLGLGVASPVTQHRACGIYLYYFLPALLTLVVALAAYRGMRLRFRAMLLGVAITVHATIGFAPQWVKVYVPFGLPLVLFLMPLGLVAEAVYLRRLKKPSLAAGAGLAMLSCGLIVSAIRLGGRIDLATLNLYGIKDIGLFLMQDAILVTAFVAVVMLSGVWEKIPGLTLLGSHSLLIFLAHLPVLHAVKLIFIRTGLSNLSGQSSFSILALRLVLVLVLSVLISCAIRSIRPIRNVLTPRSWRDWPVERPG